MAIGAATAILSARAGAAVCVADLDEERAQETCRTIEAEGGEALAVVGDTTSEADCAQIVATAVAEYGRLTTLVNNVGLAGAPGPLQAMLSDDQRDLRRRIAPLGIEGTAWDVALAALFLPQCRS